MNRIYRNFLLGACACLLLGGITACTDEIKIDDSQGNLPSVEPDELALGFTMSLGDLSDASSRSRSIFATDPAAYESYIDPTKIRVILFDMDGIFLFEDENIDPIPLEVNSYGENQWLIQLKGMGDDIKDYIRNNPFKIAVLANWPNRESEEAERYAQYQFYEGQSIRQLSHFFLDDNYIDSDDGDDAYGHVVLKADHVPEGWDLSHGDYQPGHLYMGVSSKWVENDITQDNAEEYIRKNYDVENGKLTGMKPSSGSDSREYANLWQIWNFGAQSNADLIATTNDDDNTETTCYNTSVSEIKNDWIDAQELLLQKAADIDDNGYVKSFISRGLKYYGRNSYYYTLVKDNQGHQGFQMARKGAISDANINLTDGYFELASPNDAQIRIKVGVHYNNDGSDSDHKVALGYKIDGVQGYEVLDLDYNNVGTDESFSEIKEIVLEPNITYYSQNVQLFALSNANNDRLVIYEIEYISPRYLGLVDRYAIMPSPQHPIPMYGIQDFDPIGEYWEPGELFNLSLYNGSSKIGYQYRSVSLLRSLARLDVLLPKSVFPEPESVFMRTFNHSARCAPIDVFTPTDIIWNGMPAGSSDGRASRYGGFVSALQELKNIQTYGPTFQKNNTKANNPYYYLKDFRVRTSWFFGIWNEPQWGWDWNATNLSGKQPINAADVPTALPSPRIFNTAVSRADFAYFAQLPDDQYWHYVMYVPEKNITDADDPGELGDRPKLVHIELRFPKETPYDAYDDNSAYRIYFTPGGLVGMPGRNEMDSYETSPDENILRQFYPIMRNHNYKFTVTGVNQGDLNFEVRSPEIRNVDITFN